MPTNQDHEIAIKGLIQAFCDGWNAQDGYACARPFTETADFTAVNGTRVRGTDEIGRGHAEILSTIFRGTHMRASVNSIEFLRPDVAVVDVTFRLTPPAEPSWIPKHTSCGIIATKEGERWAISVFRNMVPFNRPLAGQLDQEYFERSMPAEEAPQDRPAAPQVR
jgi:uncharacterized protein (TIGR02246 family)